MMDEKQGADSCGTIPKADPIRTGASIQSSNLIPVANMFLRINDREPCAGMRRNERVQLLR